MNLDTNNTELLEDMPFAESSNFVSKKVKAFKERVRAKKEAEIAAQKQQKSAQDNTQTPATDAAPKTQETTPKESDVADVKDTDTPKKILGMSPMTLGIVLAVVLVGGVVAYRMYKSKN